MNKRIAPLVAAAIVTLGMLVQAQQRGGTARTDAVPPVNAGANPYRIVRDWAQLNLEARPWGGSLIALHPLSG